jgi:RNA polymerase sigma-70 factor (ECF subfamily)
MVAEHPRMTAVGGRAALADAQASDHPLTADEVFASLTRRHVDAAFRLAWAILGDGGDAEDAAQDAFAMAWRRRDTLRDVTRFAPWFERILVNTCRERIRQRARSRVRLVAFAPEPAAWDGAGQAGLREAVGGALAGLDADHRIVVVLRYWADLTVDQIAERVGVPSGTVKSRLHYALRTLHPELEDVR